MGKRKRPRKTIKGEAEEDEANHLTPTAAYGGSHLQAANPTSSTEGFLSVPLHYPPVPSRYPTRHRNAVLGQCATLSTRSGYPIQNANCHDSTFTPAKKILVEKTESLSPTQLSPITVHIPTMDNLTPKHPFPTRYWNSLLASDLQQSRAQEKFHPSAAVTPAPPPPHEVVSGNHLSNTGANEACNIIGNGQEKMLPTNLGQKAAPIKSFSLNLTEMAAMSCENSSDDEVHSALDVALVTVNGYRVKEEFASLLRDILSKFGDIAKDSCLQSTISRSSFLEMVCGIFQKLQRTQFTDITSKDLKSMLDLITDVEFIKLEVGWLRKRLEEIYEAKLLLKGSSSLKEEKTRINEAIGKAERESEGYKAEMLMLQQKISLGEDKLAAMKSESEKINGIMLETKTKVKCFCQRSLVDGLI